MGAGRGPRCRHVPGGVLPATLVSTLARQLHIPQGEGPEALAAEVGAVIAERDDRGDALRAALRTIVGRSSRRQALAGLLSAGPWTSAKYVARKLQRAWR